MIDRVRYIIKRVSDNAVLSGNKDNRDFRPLAKLTDKVNICTYSSEAIARNAYNSVIRYSEPNLLETGEAIIVPVYENIIEITEHNKDLSPIKSQQILNSTFNLLFKDSTIIKNTFSKIKYELALPIDRVKKLIELDWVILEDLVFLSSFTREVVEKYEKEKSSHE